MDAENSQPSISVKRRLDAYIRMVLTSLDSDELEALGRLACARYFDRDVFVALGGEHLGLSFDHIIRLPIVERFAADRDNYQLIRDVREALISELAFEEYQKTCKRLYELYRDRDDVEALYHLFAIDAATACRRLMEMFSAAEATFDLARCHRLVRTAKARSAYLTPGLHFALRELERRLAAYWLWAEGRYRTVSYVERDETRSALAGLLAARAESWLLHVHGPAGAGKSMFVDHAIARRLCPDIPCAKIDFNYVVDPVAAMGEPWRLVLRMAEQLAIQLDDRSLTQLAGEYRPILEANFSAYALPRERASSARSVTEATPGTDDIVTRFGDMVSLCTGSEPVVLAFDTLDVAATGSAANIEPLLDVLIRLRQRIHGLRVIFSGRHELTSLRPDARAGFQVLELWPLPADAA